MSISNLLNYCYPKDNLFLDPHLLTYPKTEGDIRNRQTFFWALLTHAFSCNFNYKFIFYNHLGSMSVDINKLMI